MIIMTDTTNIVRNITVECKVRREMLAGAKRKRRGIK
jgi:hypothetical protein